MSEPTGSEKGKLARAVAGAAAIGGAAAGAGAGALGAGLAAGVPMVVELAQRVLASRSNARVERLFTEFVDAPSEVAPMLAKRLEQDERFRELVARTIREALQAVSEDATRPLALLLREYDRPGRTQDEFFRGAAALFSALDAVQLTMLRELLTLCVSSRQEVVEVKEHAGVLEQQEVRPPGEIVQRTFEETANPAPMGAAWRRLFNRLKREDLAWDNPAGFWDTSSGPEVLRIERATAKRLLELLR